MAVARESIVRPALPIFCYIILYVKGKDTL